MTGSPGNTYTIAPYFGPAGVKLVRVPRGDDTFFDLDVRTPYGSFDAFAAGSPAVAGVTVRIGQGTASPTGPHLATELLDTTPATTDLKDAPLLVGKTMTDPVSGISFTTMSTSAAGVVVRVREGVAPSVAGSLSGAASTTPSVDLAWSPATDNVAVASTGSHAMGPSSRRRAAARQPGPTPTSRSAQRTRTPWRPWTRPAIQDRPRPSR